MQMIADILTSQAAPQVGDATTRRLGLAHVASAFSDKCIAVMSVYSVMQM